MKDFREYIGCIHVHSVYSDGSGTFPEIIKAAQEAGLDYLLASDHMTLKGREKGFSGWHDDLFLSVGYEINDRNDQHHYLAFGLNETLPEDYNHEQYIKAVKEKGALGVAAHPFEERDVNRSVVGFPPIPWGNLDYAEIEVIEVWNMMSHWLEMTTGLNKYWNVVHPRSFSTFPSRRLLAWWDKTNLSRKVVGIGSVDVHATKIKLFKLYTKAIFDYKIMFKSIRTHLLCDDEFDQEAEIPVTEQKIFDIIRSGRTFISNYRRGDARGFRFWAEDGKSVLQMGESGVMTRPVLKAILPERGHCRLIRNGEVIQKGKATEIDIPVKPGVYRLEVLKGKRGWIYSNHINILEK
ncbi:MAG: histidinol-phosphatase [Candidatus Neomarinimicrobiota bacterium]|nr:MAG: histidinol-phosphatase [Candidatus Neomarinimicrobiota bacterium]